MAQGAAGMPAHMDALIRSASGRPSAAPRREAPRPADRVADAEQRERAAHLELATVAADARTSRALAEIDRLRRAPTAPAAVSFDGGARGMAPATRTPDDQFREAYADLKSRGHLDIEVLP